MNGITRSFRKALNQEDCLNCFDGVEGPRIVESADGTYIMTYASYDGKTAGLSIGFYSVNST